MVLQKRLGSEINLSSTQVSRCTELLDKSLEAWRNRPLDDTPYLILDARYERVRDAGQVHHLANPQDLLPPWHKRLCHPLCEACDYKI